MTRGHPQSSFPNNASDAGLFKFKFQTNALVLQSKHCAIADHHRRVSNNAKRTLSSEKQRSTKILLQKNDKKAQNFL
jgi:hypothetical protein